jgi:hypothetical protein
MSKRKGRLQEMIDREPKLDATDERLSRAIEESHGGAAEAWEWVDPSRIDSNKPIGLVRRFKATHLDRLYRKDSIERSRLSWRQWYAGDWYRSVHARAALSFSVISSYGERVSGAEPSYGMPRTERQANARKQWREARGQFPKHMAAFMDMLLLHDEIPAYASTRAGQKGRERIIQEVAYSLDKLADWLQLGVEQSAA